MNDNGRCAILLPHGVLNRIVETDIRKEWLVTDTVDAIISVGKNLFYNSPMEACVIICRKNKPANRRGKIQFIDARDLVTRNSTMSFLTKEHIKEIVKCYRDYRDEDGRSAIVENHIVSANKDCSMNVSLQVRKTQSNSIMNLEDLVSEWDKMSQSAINSLNSLKEILS